MKLLLLALVAAFPAVAQAQAVYRCEVGLAHVSYQQTACDAATRVGLVSPEPFSPTDAEIGQPSARRQRAKAEGVAIAARVLMRQESPNQRDALRHAENRGRCAEALRIAHLCGRHAGTFYCDAKGFQAVPEAARAKAVSLNNSDRHLMERCARDAKARRP